MSRTLQWTVLFPAWAFMAVVAWHKIGEPFIIGPPQTISDMRAVEPRIRVSEPLIVSFVLHTNRHCPVQIDRWVVGAALYNLASSFGTVGNLGGVTQRVSSIGLPHLPPGQYTFHSRATYKCSMFHEYVDLREPVAFEVVK